MKREVVGVKAKEIDSKDLMILDDEELREICGGGACAGIGLGLDAVACFGEGVGADEDGEGVGAYACFVFGIGLGVFNQNDPFDD